MPLQTETKMLDSVKKNPTLPLFGKRGTFKYSSVVTQPKVTNPIQQSTHDNKSDEEEIEENDEREATSTKLDIDPNIKNLIEDKRKKELPTPDRLIPSPKKETLKRPAKEKPQEKQEVTVDDGEEDSVNVKNVESNSSSGSSSNITKKKRNRIRIRTDKGRENVDFDEEMVDTEKYSTWLPPQGQSGDGNTDLNEKYGY